MIVLARQCDKRGDNTIYIKGKPYEVLKREIDTIRTNTTSVIYKSAKDIVRDTTIFVPYEKDEPIDTAAILAAYNSKNVYSDTLKLDSIGSKLFLTDTVQRNLIVGRRFTINSIRDEIRTSIYLEDISPRIYIKGGLRVSKMSLMPTIGVEVLRHKRLSYEFNYATDKSIGLGVLFRLK